MYELLINPTEKLPKVVQITQALVRDIEKDLLKLDEQSNSLVKSQLSKKRLVKSNSTKSTS